MNVTVADLPLGGLVGIGVLGLVQVSLQVLALLTAFRTPEERLAGGKRWIWILIVVFGQLLGAILFLAVARRPAPDEDPLRREDTASSVDARARRAADVLYGDSSDKKA